MDCSNTQRDTNTELYFFFYIFNPNKLLNKQSSCWWRLTPHDAHVTSRWCHISPPRASYVVSIAIIWNHIELHRYDAVTWAWWRLKSPATTLFAHPTINSNVHQRKHRIWALLITFAGNCMIWWVTTTLTHWSQVNIDYGKGFLLVRYQSITWTWYCHIN